MSRPVIRKVALLTRVCTRTASLLGLGSSLLFFKSGLDVGVDYSRMLSHTCESLYDTTREKNPQSSRTRATNSIWGTSNPKLAAGMRLALLGFVHQACMLPCLGTFVHLGAVDQERSATRHQWAVRCSAPPCVYRKSAHWNGHGLVSYWSWELVSRMWRIRHVFRKDICCCLGWLGYSEAGAVDIPCEERRSGASGRVHRGMGEIRTEDSI